jgi:hypothetical protein
MKNLVQKLAFVAMITLPAFIMAQPMPGDTGVGGGPGGNPVGGPIDGGLLILLTLAASYGTKKVYNARKKVLD